MPARGKGSFWRYVVVASVFAVFMSAVFFSIPGGVSPRDANGAFMILYVLTIAWIYPLAVIHEAGHALAAASQRLRIWWFHVGPLVIARRNVRSLRTTWLGEQKEPLGSVLAYPIDGNNLGRRFTICVAGGPLASIASLIAALVLSNEASARGSIAGEYFARSALIASTFMVLSTILHFGTTDTATLLGVLSRRLDPAKTLAIAGLIASSCAGTRPRDWNVDLVSAIANPHDSDTVNSNAPILSYYSALDRQDFNSAAHFLEAAHRCVAPELRRARSSINNEAAFFAAAIRADLETARAYREQVDESAVHSHDLLRADAAIAALEGDHVKAATLAREALTLQAGCEDLGWAIAERDLLDRYIKVPPQKAADVV